MATSNQQNFQSSNEAYAKSFTKGDLALPPAKKYAVVTCMDARIDPVQAFARRKSKEKMHILQVLTRGRVSLSATPISSETQEDQPVEALRSLIISEQLLGTTEVFIVKHTGCGMLTFKNEDAWAVVGNNLGQEAEEAVKGLDFLPFSELDGAVKHDVEFVKAQKTIPDNIVVSGWVYEVETGRAV